jgi:hypothetical protein
MSETRFPGYQNMISRDSEEVVRTRHEQNLQHYNAGHEDCIIKNMEVCTPNSLEYRQGFRCTFQLHFTSYKGWKVYMLNTGCFASIPEYENQFLWEQKQEQRARDQATGNLNAHMGYPED